MRNATKPFPRWATRTHRALPKISAARVDEIAPEVLENQERLAVALIARPLAATVVFAMAAYAGLWLVAVPAVFLTYGSCITAVHHLIHGSLGLSVRWRHFWLSAPGTLVVESGHALQTTHLAHHRTSIDAPDPEGYIENVSWKDMPIAAFKFRYRLMTWGFRYSPRRRRVTAELLAHAALHLASLVLLPVSPILWIYLTLIHISSFAFAVMAGKGPQTNYGRDISSPIIRVKTRIGRFLLLSHDRHLEHHIYPKVPLPRLHKLDEQLNPTWAELDVVEVSMPL